MTVCEGLIIVNLREAQQEIFTKGPQNDREGQIGSFFFGLLVDFSSFQYIDISPKFDLK